MTIKDLIEKRAKVWETAKNFVETHEDKNGVLSDEDTATYNKMEKEMAKNPRLRANIEDIMKNLKNE